MHPVYVIILKLYHMRKTFFLSAFIILGLISNAQEAFDISNYQVNINLHPEGHFDVKETITTEFSQERRGIIRQIPLINELGGKKFRMELSDIRVEGWPMKAERRGGVQHLRIGDPNKTIIGTQKFIIDYRVNKAILTYDGFDEFYWNVTGHEWDVPIENASFSLRFPPEWTEHIQEYKSYSGVRNDTTTQLFLDKSQGRITGSMKAPLGPKEGVTLVIRIPDSLIQGVPFLTNTNNSKGNKALTKTNHWLNLIPIGLALFLLRTWQRLGNKKPREDSGEEIYYPPDNISPAEVGTFYDNRVNRRDLISMIPYWGQQGYLKIKANGDKVILQKVQDLPANRPDYEHTFFNDLFELGSTVRLEDLKNSFYTTMSKVSKKINQQVLRLRLYDEKALKIFHSGWMIAAFLVLLLSGISSILLLNLFMGFGLIILGIMCLIIHFLQPKLSMEGIEFYKQLTSLKRHLEKPDEERLAQLLKEDPDYLNILFPYALAFGLDKNWEKQFDKLFTKPPDWYIYDGPYYDGGMHDFGRFTRTFGPRKYEDIMYSTPAPAPSSSGSNFGGGFSSGSSGGGFGGGGGSSW